MHRFVTARLLILIGILLTLEYSFSSLFSPLRGRADLLYLIVLDYAFFWSWEAVPFFAFGIGLLRDFAGGHLFGIETASLTATGVLLYPVVQKLDRENFWVRIVMSFLFVWLTEILSISLGRGLEISKGLSGEFMGDVFWTALYTTALAPLFFRLTHLWFKRIPALKQYELFR